MNRRNLRLKGFRVIAMVVATILMTSCFSLFPGGILSDASRNKFFKENPGMTVEVKNAIRAGKILIGMTEQEVVHSIGFPSNINRSTFSFGTTAQFVYRMYPRFNNDLYVYFENGRVTSWQE
jgi:hypothetical protein